MRQEPKDEDALRAIDSVFAALERHLLGAVDAIQRLRSLVKRVPRVVVVEERDEPKA